MKAQFIKQTNNNIQKLTWITLFFGLIIYKISTELGYYYILSNNSPIYIVNFNIWKYLLGWLWCFVLFFFIRHERRRVSTFMLYLLLVSQVVPLTCIYALANENSLYYNSVCFSILIAEVLVGWIRYNGNKIIKVKLNILHISLVVFAFSLVVFLFLVYFNNGLPTTIALNIFRVYELRSSGLFQIGKYGSYLLTWLVMTIIPYLVALCMDRKKYLYSIMLFLSVFILYLYAGHKSFLFSIPLIFLCSIWTKRKNAYGELWFVFCIAFSAIVILSIELNNKFFDEVYSAVGRRLTLLSAMNKYYYFDFFSQNPKLGIVGIFPRWLVPVDNPYDGKVIGNIIAELYYNSPEMNSNTGFLAEGFARFGIIGMFMEMIVYTWVLKLEDAMSEKAGYALTVSAFVYPMLMLTDGFLLNNIVIGHFTFVVIIALVYKYFVSYRKE